MKILLSICWLMFSSVLVFGQATQDKVRQSAEMFVAAYNSKDYARIEKEFSAQMNAAMQNQLRGGQLAIFKPAISTGKYQKRYEEPKEKEPVTFDCIAHGVTNVLK